MEIGTEPVGGGLLVHRPGGQELFPLDIGAGPGTAAAIHAFGTQTNRHPLGGLDAQAEIVEFAAAVPGVQVPDITEEIAGVPVEVVRRPVTETQVVTLGLAQPQAGPGVGVAAQA